jgi:hypothetical protein
MARVIGNEIMDKWNIVIKEKAGTIEVIDSPN